MKYYAFLGHNRLTAVFILGMLLFFCMGVTQAQNFDAVSVRELRKSAKGAYDYGKYDFSEKQYKLLLKRDTARASEYHYYLGMCMMMQDKPEDAIYELILAKKRGFESEGKWSIRWHDFLLDYVSEQPDWMLARAYHRIGEYSTATRFYRSFEKGVNRNGKVSHDEKKIIRHYSVQAHNARILNTQPQDTVKVKALSVLNTKGDEFCAFSDVYHSEIVYTRHPKFGKDDLFRATRLDSTKQNKKFSVESIGMEIPEGEQPTVVWMGPENQNLILCLADGFRRKYVEYGKDSTGWAERGQITLGSFFAFDINSVHLSLDRNTMLLAAIGPDTQGGSDIYRCNRLPNGDWSTPFNLGRKINTRWDESSPFLDPISNDLYFSTKGRTSIGGFDIFRAEYDPERNRWKHPENLGLPINSPDDEVTFSMTPDASKAFISSDRYGGKGGLDIYEILYEGSRKNHAMAFGLVKSQLTYHSIRSTVTIVDTLFPNDTLRMYTNRSSGNFTHLLETGHTYAITASAPGYSTQTLHVSFPKRDAYYVEEIEFLMEQNIKPKKFNLANVLFEQNKSELLSESFIELDSVAFHLRDSAQYYIQVCGHTQLGGLEKSNLELSQARAEVVADYLNKRGVPKSRLIAVGYGSRYPLTRSKDPLEQKKNRRTELIIHDLTLDIDRGDLEFYPEELLIEETDEPPSEDPELETEEEVIDPRLEIPFDD